jgi:small subunit ribosomal protein S36
MNRLRRVWRRYHVLVWWVIVIKALFGLSYTLLVPVYHGPDETQHVDMVRWYQSHAGYADPTEQPRRSPAVVASQRMVSPEVSPRPPLRALDAVPRPDRVPFADLEPPEGPLGTNQMSQHPPLYYAMTEAGSSLAGLLPSEAWTWDREVYLYRLISWLTFLTLPLLAAEAALALGLARAFTAVAASITLLVPMTTFIGSVVNNDGLATAFTALAVVGALGYLRQGSLRWAAVAAVGCAGAPLTKSTAAPAVAWVLVVMAVAMVRSSGWRPSARTLRHAALVGAAALVGLSWQITNVVRFNDPQPNGFTQQPRTGYDASITDYVPDWIARVSSTFWGQPARRTGVTLAPWMITSLTVAAAVVCLYALVRARRFRWPVWLLSVLVAGQVALMFRTNWKSHQRAGTLNGLQGRYLFALVVPLAVLATVGVAALVHRRRTANDIDEAVHEGVGEDDATQATAGRTTAGIAAAVAAAGVGLHVFLGWSMLTGGYWATDGDGVGGQLRAVVAWSPLPALLTITTFLATGLAVVLAAVWAARQIWLGRAVEHRAARDLVEAGSG